MSRPTVATVLRALLSTELQVRMTVWRPGKVTRRGKIIDVRTHYFGYYDTGDDLIVLGRCETKKWGQVDELVATHIHEVLHKVRPDWPEVTVRMEEKRYARSRLLREASLTKILNVTLFGRDLDLTTVTQRGNEDGDGHGHRPDVSASGSEGLAGGVAGEGSGETPAGDCSDTDGAAANADVPKADA